MYQDKKLEKIDKKDIQNADEIFMGFDQGFHDKTVVVYSAYWKNFKGKGERYHTFAIWEIPGILSPVNPLTEIHSISFEGFKMTREYLDKIELEWGLATTFKDMYPDDEVSLDTPIRFWKDKNGNVKKVRRISTRGSLFAKRNIDENTPKFLAKFENDALFWESIGYKFENKWDIAEEDLRKVSNDDTEVVQLLVDLCRKGIWTFEPELEWLDGSYVRHSENVYTAVFMHIVVKLATEDTKKSLK